MLRKISTLLATVLCLGLMVSCSPTENDAIEINNDTTPVETPKTESDTQSADDTTESGTTNTNYYEHDITSIIVGKFQCASDYFKVDYFLEHQGSIPYIFFKEEGCCIMGINYLEGGCDIPGEYSIIGNEIEVKLDFSNSVLDNTASDDSNRSFVTDVYKFSIIDENTISIGSACFSVNPGDIFVLIND